jgi:ribosome maturation factor RimP
MSHPLIPQIASIAEAVALELELEVVNIVLQTNKNPMVLRVDIRNPEQDTGLDDCEKMSRALEAALDDVDFIPYAYVLEISSPGISRQLASDREFITFRGFMVTVNTISPYEGKQSWQGHLIGRSDTQVSISIKGRIANIPRDLVAQVELSS